MSDDLVERLKLHSNAFDGLLSLLPEGDDTTILKKKTKNKKKKKPAKEVDGNDDNKETAKVVPQENNQPAKTVKKTPSKEQSAPVKKTEKKSSKVPAVEVAKEASNTKEAKKESDSVELKPAAKKVSAKEGSEKEESAPVLPAKSDPKKLEELRSQLSSRIQEMREKRKAPGTAVKGAPKDRKTAVEARQQRKQKEKEKRVLKRKRAEAELDNDDDESDKELADEITEDDNTVFTQVVFQDGGKASRDFKNVKVKKTKGPRDLLGQLKHIEAKKAKLESLDSEKRESIETKTKWSRALALAEGEKVRDDEKLLRKAIKRQTKDKKKSAKTWKERQETVTKNIADKQKKREDNIAAKRERNKLKSKKAKQKAGVIGRGRKPSKKRVKRN
ncbi:hypothetical protein D0Z00_003273 [Geotrichum galactomycetum]|uniref:Uncharacterized protein n=1 Tax=Geotrichum galactomycetum TaxID=27317 RepID=A0ACB6V1U5_9ASCO|nr:hypothetical protein D0Z00_003273 [Geotrichum candidum]